MGQKRFFTLILLLSISLFSFSAWSQSSVQIISAPGASNFFVGNGTTIPVIYAGIVGTACGTTDAAGNVPIANGDGTCNTCDPAVSTPTACGTHRIDPGQNLTINFTVTGAITGPVQVGYSFQSGGSAGISIMPGYIDPTGGATLQQGSTSYVTIPWSVLCGLGNGVDGNADDTCTNTPTGYTGGNISIYIGLNDVTQVANDGQAYLYILGYVGDESNGNNINTISIDSDAEAFGIDGFQAAPGDGKVYITNLSVLSGSSCNPLYVASAQVFYSTSGFAQAIYGGPSASLPMGSGCTPSGTWIVDGLQNGTTYYFNISILDYAFNNVFLIDPNWITAGTDNPEASQCSLTTQPTENSNAPYCDFIATPGAVTGLLPNAFNCFISTAAYGSGYAPQVNTFRKFRDRFLIPNRFGRAFTRAYYTYGKILAEQIAGRPNRQFIARVFLAPLWAFAWLSIQYGIIATFLIILSMWFLVSSTWRELRRAH